MKIKFGVEQTVKQRFEWIYEVADGLTVDEIESQITSDIKKYRGAWSAGDVAYSLEYLSRRKGVAVKRLDTLEDVENVSLEFDTFEVTNSNNFDEEYPEDSDDDYEEFDEE